MAKKRKLRSSESQPSDPQQITLHYVPVEYQPPDDQIPDPEQPEQQQEEQQVKVEEELEEAEKQQEEEEEEEKQQEEEIEYVEEPVEKLLEPLAKEQLVLLLKEAVTNHPDLIQIINKLADTDPAHRKIFVHGLGYDTTSDTLISFFSSYGDIEDCKAVVDKISGKSKGYAFILFKNRSGARNALKAPQKTIGNRTASCQLASEGPVANAATSANATSAVAMSAPVAVSEYTQRKIFVSNVSGDVDPKRLVEFFSQFGEIEEGPLGIDKQTGRFKGFCLFVYRSVEGAKKALEEPHKLWDGTTLLCKKAVDGPIHSKAPHQHNFRREKRPYPGQGHMMAPPSHMGSNLGPDLAPVIGQALTALLANQGGNLLGGFGAQQGMNNQGYNNQGYNQQYGGGGYGAPRPQGGYQNQQMGGGPYMGHNR